MTPQAAAAPWQPGDVLGGRYRLESLLGRGAMAEVWRAEHVTLGTAVAVKLVSPKASGNPEQTLERFLQEARAAAALRSPFVVHIYDQGSEGDCGYIAMELLEGESLRHRLDRLGRLAPLEVARVVSQLAAGIGLAHEAGVVHRDLKPENVFLATVHGQEVAKVLDFGIAKRVDLRSLDRLASHEGVIVGTPCYMSPEQITSTHPVDARSDLWQLGVIAFECLCGRRPFDAPTAGELMVNICSKPPPVPSELVPVPEGFDEWFAQAVSLDPPNRFPSAGALAESLCWILAPETSASALAGNIALGPASTLQSNPSLLEQSGVTRRSGRQRSAGATERRGQQRTIAAAVGLSMVVAVAGIVVGSWVLSAPAPQQGPAAVGSGGEPPTPTGIATDGERALQAPEQDGGPSERAVGADTARGDETKRPTPTTPSTGQKAPATAVPPMPRPGHTAAPVTKPRPEDVLGI